MAMKLPSRYKVRLFSRIVWGLIVTFVLIGSLIGKGEIAIMLAIMVTLMWVLIRIIDEAIDAVTLLQMPDDKDDKEG